MYSNVGLATAKGSGTSGFVQRNASALTSFQKAGAANAGTFTKKTIAPPRQLSAELIEHNRKREVEVRVVELEDELREKKYVSFPTYGPLYSDCGLSHPLFPLCSPLESLRKKSSAAVLSSVRLSSPTCRPKPLSPMPLPAALLHAAMRRLSAARCVSLVTRASPLLALTPPLTLALALALLLLLLGTVPTWPAALPLSLRPSTRHSPLATPTASTWMPCNPSSPPCVGATEGRLVMTTALLLLLPLPRPPPVAPARVRGLLTQAVVVSRVSEERVAVAL